jgi:hypothetical protein
MVFRNRESLIHVIHGSAKRFHLKRSGSGRARYLYANGPSSAGVVKLVDARDSKSRSARSVGSSPTTRTNFLVSDPSVRHALCDDAP